MAGSYCAQFCQCQNANQTRSALPGSPQKVGAVAPSFEMENRTTTKKNPVFKHQVNLPPWYERNRKWLLSIEAESRDQHLGNTHEVGEFLETQNILLVNSAVCKTRERPTSSLRVTCHIRGHIATCSGSSTALLTCNAHPSPPQGTEEFCFIH